MKSEKDYEIVGDIRIKEKPKKNKKKKKKTSDASLLTKVFVWFMFIAMLASFLVPLIIYLVSIISGS